MINQNQITTLKTLLNPIFSWSDRTKQVVVSENNLSHKNMSINEFCIKISVKYNIQINENDVKNVLWQTEINNTIQQQQQTPTISCLDAIKNCLTTTKRFKISTSFGEIETRSENSNVFLPSDIDDLYNHLIAERVRK